MKNKTDIEFLTGEPYTDQRGTLIHFNNFNLERIKRMYIIEHPDINIVRAWLAHKIESKWFFVLNGCFKLILLKPDDWQKPSANLKYSEFLLESDKNKILYVPGGYAYGFKATKPHSKMMVFSDFNIEDSTSDDYRFDKNLWYNWK
jgi:dTDP-4-dehydrorhamnose 3,5-epimerase-like enzyme